MSLDRSLVTEVSLSAVPPLFLTVKYALGHVLVDRLRHVRVGDLELWGAVAAAARQHETGGEGEGGGEGGTAVHGFCPLTIFGSALV